MGFGLKASRYRHALMAAACLFCAGQAGADEWSRVPAGRVLTPDSSLPQAGHGLRAHTNFSVFFPNANPNPAPAKPNAIPNAIPTPGTFYETPASLACLYKLVAVTTGCNPTVVTVVSKRGSHAIAIVDAYHDPNAFSDLAAYSAEFGLPAPTASTFQVIYAAAGTSTQTTTAPPQDPSGGWEIEESLDVDMAHAMAPKAKLYLVEAHSNSFADLYPAIVLASNLVAAAGGGEVSLSWGSGEFAGETSYDSYLTTPNVVYFASAGDAAGVSFPSTSPNAVSAGGTTISRNSTTGDFEVESAWPNTGGGPSANEPRPSYQAGIAGIVGSHRGTPDMSFDADTRTPVWVYDTVPLNGSAGTWYLVGGTSASAPGLAGIVNAAGTVFASTNAALTTIYSNLGVAADFRDITKGNCGAYAGFLAATGWDFCTGIGSNQGIGGK